MYTHGGGAHRQHTIFSCPPNGIRTSGHGIHRISRPTLELSQLDLDDVYNIAGLKKKYIYINSNSSIRIIGSDRFEEIGEMDRELLLSVCESQVLDKVIISNFFDSADYITYLIQLLRSRFRF